MQSRYEQGRRRGLHQLPLRHAEQYEAFIDALLAGEKTEFHDWEKDTPYFEGCLPIEVMAERGARNLALGPMKPVGLRDPRTRPRRLRRGAAAPGQRARHALQHGGLPDQAEAWRAEAHLPHDPRPRRRADSPASAACTATPSSTAPSCSTARCGSRPMPRLRFAGQITGVEGYVESAAIGPCSPAASPPPSFWAARCAPPPPTTALGALLEHITGGADARSFQPMNVNFGLFPPIAEAPAEGKRLKGAARGIARKKGAFRPRARGSKPMA